MNKLNLKTSAFAMSYISNEEKVRDMVRALDIKMRRQPLSHDPNGIKVTAVCFKPQRCKNLGDYIEKMNRYVAEPAAQGSALVAFPELIALETMSLMPRFSSIHADLLKLRKSDIQQQRDAFFTVCETVQGFVGEIFLNTFSQLARSHRMIIAAGGMYHLENGKIYNRQYLFSEEGDVIGMQDKLFLSESESRLGVTAGEKLTPGVSRLGKIALLSGSSLSHYEPYWIASRMGCRYAVAASSPFGRTHNKLARFRAQEEKLCIIVPGLCGGKEYGMSLSSAAGIYMPRAAAPEQGGVMAETVTEPFVTERVDLASAAQYFDMYSDDKNMRFFQKLISEE